MFEDIKQQQQKTSHYLDHFDLLIITLLYIYAPSSFDPGLHVFLSLSSSSSLAASCLSLVASITSLLNLDRSLSKLEIVILELQFAAAWPESYI